MRLFASCAPGLEPLWGQGPLLAPHRYVAFTKGAVERVLQVAPAVWDGVRPQPLTDDWRARIKKAHDGLAQDGMRVLGLDVAASPVEIRRRLGYMPEIDAHIPGMNAVSFVAYCAQLAGLPAVDAEARSALLSFHAGRTYGDAFVATLGWLASEPSLRFADGARVADKPDLLPLASRLVREH